MVSRSNTPITVTLTAQEMMLAAYAGVRRCVASLSRGSQDAFGCNEADGWGLHVEGSGGEMAAAKVLNMYWDGAFDTYSRGDVGALQIRTRTKHDWDLIVRSKDSDDDRFVLVTGTMPTFHVHGWILGKAAKDERWLRTHGNRPPAYFVPQSELLSLDTLEIKKSFDQTLARNSRAG
jgi:hypothetical protein